VGNPPKDCLEFDMSKRDRSFDEDLDDAELTRKVKAKTSFTNSSEQKHAAELFMSEQRTRNLQGGAGAAGGAG